MAENEVAARNEVVAAYIVIAEDDEEKEKYTKKTTKEKLIELVDAFKEEGMNDKLTLITLRKENHDQHAQILNKDLLIATLQDENKSKEVKLADADKENILLRSKLCEEKDAKKLVIDELLLTKSKLVKKNELAADLMNVLDEKSGSANWGDDVQKLLIIVDERLEAVLDQIKLDSTSWDKFVLTKGIDGLKTMLESEDHRMKIYGYEKVLMLVGLTDILAGREGFTVGNTACVAATKIRDLQVDVGIVELPPVAKGKPSTMLSCFNNKVKNASNINQVILIDSAFDMIMTDDLINDDGTFIPVVFDIIASAISKQIIMPGKRSKDPFKTSTKPIKQMKTETKPAVAIKDYIREIFPFNKSITGLVIGSGGNTIRSLEDESGAKLHVMDWEGEKAVLIQSTNQNSILAAKAKLEELIAGAKETRSKRKQEPANLSGYKKIK